ncbi:substrate-binding periplasmic protein [Pseudomonas sp. BMS12]|uniref:substrate-binding periplasmic protein n=1 Tax=Pseudomonas sp. BMS12 TaxID=1796033 RepID=UPI00083B4263|nr:transporter substrate-binding domain-containing protein [Pseudomonas sp. BMS12]
MSMRIWLLALSLCLAWPSVQAAEALPTDIQLISEYWPGHTNPDGSGVAWEIMRAVFEPVGVTVHLRNEPYMRSIGLVQRGEADAWLGSYPNEVSERVFYPQHPYDADRILALGLATQARPTLETLQRYHLIWVRGYGYEEYLPGPLRFQEIERRNGILDMLARGRADFYIDASTEVDEVLAGSQEPERFRSYALTRLPLYPGFADTARGRTLAALYDRRMAELVRSGSLRPIFSRWQQPYPFDEDMEKLDASP